MNRCKKRPFQKKKKRKEKKRKEKKKSLKKRSGKTCKKLRIKICQKINWFFFYLGTKLNCTNGIIVITVLFKPQWNQLTCWMSCLCSSLSALKREDWWKMEGLSLTLYQKKWQSFWNSIHRKDSWTLLAFPVFWRFIALYYTVYW